MYNPLASLMPVILRLQGTSVTSLLSLGRHSIWIAPTVLKRQATASKSLRITINTFVFALMAEEHKRRQVGPACSWGHQAAFRFRESGLQFTMKQLRESSNHSGCQPCPAAPVACSLRESICRGSADFRLMETGIGLGLVESQPQKPCLCLVVSPKRRTTLSTRC